MANARLRGIPLWQFFNSTGAVLASGTINFYSPGTTTDKDIYKDTGKAATADNPITLDAAGRVPYALFGDGFYDVVVKDSSGSTQMTISNWGDDWSAVGTDLSANPLSNHSFETAGSGSEAFSNWTETDPGALITRDTTANTGQTHGVASAKFTLTKNSEESILSDAFEIDELQELKLEFDIKANNATSQPKIEVDWLDSAQGALSSSTIYSSPEGKTPTSWTRIRGLNVTPVTNAKYAQIKITGNAHATQYTVSFDNLVISQSLAFSGEVPYQPVGLVLSRDAGDTSHDINVTAGATKDENLTEDIVLTTEITKQMDASWAIGDDAGGHDGTVLPASGIFYVWLIKNPTTGNVDVLGSTSPTAPTMPSGYTVKRLIGAWLTDASNNLVDGVHKADYFRFFEYVEDVNDSSLTSGSASMETATLSCPPECRAIITAALNFDGGTPDDDAYILLEPIGASTASSSEGAWLGIETITAEANGVTAEGDIYVDASSQCNYGAEFTPASGGVMVIRTFGWHMLTRDNP